MSCFGGGSSSSNNNNNNSSNDNDSGGGFLGTSYSSFADMFDGGGPGMSGSSFSTQDNRDLDTDGDNYISDQETLAGTGGLNLAGGLDGGSTSERDLITSDLTDDEFFEEFEANVPRNDDDMASDFYGGSSGYENTGLQAKAITTNYEAPDVIDTTVTNNTSTTNNDDTTNNTTTNDDTTNNTTTTNNNTTTTNNNSLIDDLNNQIADLQNQLNSMNNSGGGNTIVYEGAGDTNTSLPDDYLTEADLAKYLDNLDLGSNAYDPAAFLNAYGFALDPTMMGNLIPTMQGNNGLFVRRAVRDRDTGEIRYVNVPIGAGATGGNQGLSQFQMERRAGFGNLL